jgi:hypothetical protein
MKMLCSRRPNIKRLLAITERSLLLSAAAILAAGATVTGVAHAGSSPSAPHLTAPRPLGGTAPIITGAMTYHGGPVENAPQVFTVFWGWTSDPSGEGPYLTNLLSSLGGSPWLNTVTQYQGGNPAALYGGSWSDPTPVPAQPTDANLQSEAVAAANHFGLGNSVNIEIVVATPTGHSTSGFGTSYCAYHGAVAARPNITYTDLPYMTDAGASCGANSVNGANGTLDGVSIVEGHELAETITDPLLNAWFDAGGNEIGDKCAWTNLADITTSRGTFAMQPLWSNASNGCVMSYNPGPQWSPWLSEVGAPPPGVAAGSSPAVSSWGANRLDLFVRGADNAIWHDWWDGTRWNVWQSLGPAIVSNPAAVSWAANRIDLFGVGTDGNIWHKVWNGSSWSGWASEVGHPPPGLASGSGPAVSSWGANRLDLFVRGADNAIWHAWWDGTRWNFWESQGPAIVSSPAAVSWAANRIDLFGTGTDGNVYHKVWNGSSWSGWVSDMGHPPPGLASGSGPAVSSWAANRLDLFSRGADNAIWHAWWDGSRWNGWESRGPTIVSSPAAVSWGLNRIDLFGISTDGHVWHQYFG